MENRISRQTALQGLRVLDFCTHATQYCGKLLAQLGAEVILVEPPAGSATRRNGPFIGDEPHTERSLSYAYLNQGKKSVCLDLSRPEGRDLALRLAQTADIMIEDQGVGVLERFDLGYADLCAVRPSLVLTRISPYGLTGPYAAYAGDDLSTLAMGGLLYLGGYPDTEPLAAYGQQAYLAAAQFAAVGSLIALWECETHSGSGQLVDVSIQECVSMALENAAQFVDLEETVRRRNGGQQRQAGTGVFSCRDGMVYLMAGGIAANRFWAATAKWLMDAGAPGAASLLEPQWQDPEFLASDGAKEKFEQIFLPYAATRTKAELYADGQQRRIPICPVSTSADLLVNPQLRHRHFFQMTAHPYTGASFAVPGAPYRLTETPWQLGAPAPRLGEHTASILSELGIEFMDQEILLLSGVTA
ncbi:CoA-transferase family III family protein 7 [Achromobacter xylosoxidans A8]|uniref:CoA-transferase family III family protein 7 n=1 Tax=Achromobacter xylosoxidans (strain A8) TaxID=762376 RepID=E3HIJ6_ACHXA|nr:CoA transferase [Achromobacter xylosoxidans]ADP14281.1 CoA-transferase family III family protein 7 [Achromobacter xylosoxidans A8]